VILARAVDGPPPVGFLSCGAPSGGHPSGGAPIRLPDEGHVITFAPTGSGKSVGGAIPALLQHPGPVVALDIRGELSAVTARAREEMGQRVIVVDPEGITGGTHGHAIGGLNPLELVEPGTEAAFQDARAIADWMLPVRFDDRDVFWRNRAKYYLTAEILRVATGRARRKRNLVSVRDGVHRLSGEVMERASNPMAPFRVKKAPARVHPAVARAEAILGMGSTDTVGGMLHTALEAVGFIEGPGVERSLSTMDFGFDDITEGRPLTIYLVVPPHLLEALSPLVRLWFGSIFMALTRRRSRPEHATLVLLDEAAQLGPFDELRQAITLLRGYGVQTWSFWQDGAQLRTTFPTDWPTIVNNCRVLQTFGLRNDAARSQTAECLGVDPALLEGLAPDRMAIGVDGDFRRAGRVDYRTDPAFAGRFDPNPAYAPPSGPHRRPTVPAVVPKAPAAPAGEADFSVVWDHFAAVFEASGPRGR
jgi:type IV secretion system protein VirD4